MDVGKNNVQPHNQNQTLDDNVLTEQITRQMTSAIMNNLRVAGLLQNQTQQQMNVTQFRSL